MHEMKPRDILRIHQALQDENIIPRPRPTSQIASKSKSPLRKKQEMDAEKEKIFKRDGMIGELSKMFLKEKDEENQDEGVDRPVDRWTDDNRRDQGEGGGSAGGNGGQGGRRGTRGEARESRDGQGNSGSTPTPKSQPPGKRRMSGFKGEARDDGDISSILHDQSSDFNPMRMDVMGERVRPGTMIAIPPVHLEGERGEEYGEMMASPKISDMDRPESNMRADTVGRDNRDNSQGMPSVQGGEGRRSVVASVGGGKSRPPMSMQRSGSNVGEPSALSAKGGKGGDGTPFSGNGEGTGNENIESRHRGSTQGTIPIPSNARPSVSISPALPLPVQDPLPLSHRNSNPNILSVSGDKSRHNPSVSALSRGKKNNQSIVDNIMRIHAQRIEDEREEMDNHYGEGAHSNRLSNHHSNRPSNRPSSRHSNRQSDNHSRSPQVDMNRERMKALFEEKKREILARGKKRYRLPGERMEERLRHRRELREKNQGQSPSPVKGKGKSTSARKINKKYQFKNRQTMEGNWAGASLETLHTDELMAYYKDLLVKANRDLTEYDKMQLELKKIEYQQMIINSQREIGSPPRNKSQSPSRRSPGKSKSRSPGKQRRRAVTPLAFSKEFEERNIRMSSPPREKKAPSSPGREVPWSPAGKSTTVRTPKTKGKENKVRESGQA